MFRGLIARSSINRYGRAGNSVCGTVWRLMFLLNPFNFRLRAVSVSCGWSELGEAYTGCVEVMITLNLTPEIEAGLLSQARATGVSPEEYVASFVRPAVAEIPLTATPDDKTLAFDQWVGTQTLTVVLSDAAMSREAIYEDRGL